MENLLARPVEEPGMEEALEPAKDILPASSCKLNDVAGSEKPVTVNVAQYFQVPYGKGKVRNWRTVEARPPCHALRRCNFFVIKVFHQAGIGNRDALAWKTARANPCGV